MNSTQIPTSFIEELKQKSDIVSVISRYISLDRKGKTFWGLCPFHGEKTPSFAVNENEQFYHCFGCKESGDVFSFVQKMESCTFQEAIHILADWAGMKVPEVKTEKDEAQAKLKKECLAALKDVARYYFECLNSPAGKDGQEYLKRREVPTQIARVFGLGYCPDYTSSKQHLNKLGYSDDVLLSAGILKKGEHGLYDPMGQRLVFPVLNVYGDVVAFTGRTLKTKVDFAKYLNTAETCVYSKGRNLYAINLVKKYQKNGQKFDYFILCEGNMDVVSLHKAGFGMSVAGMGTALTTEQAKLIKRFVSKVYICYDGDTAGKKATLRGLDILKEQGLDVLVMSLPEGKDPDDLIKQDGKQAFVKLIEEALPLVEYRLRTLATDFDMTTFDGRSKYTTAAIEVLKELPSEVEREAYIPLVQQISGTNRDFLRRYLNSEKIAEATAEIKFDEKQQPETKNSLSKAEITALAVIYHQSCPQKLAELMSQIKYFNELFASPQLLTEIINKTPSNKLLELFPQFSSEVGEIVVSELSPKQKPDEQLEDCVKVLQNEYLTKKQQQLNEKIAQTPDREERQKLLFELSQITKERNLNKR